MVNNLKVYSRKKIIDSLSSLIFKCRNCGYRPLFKLLNLLFCDNFNNWDRYLFGMLANLAKREVVENMQVSHGKTFKFTFIISRFKILRPSPKHLDLKWASLLENRQPSLNMWNVAKNSQVTYLFARLARI